MHVQDNSRSICGCMACSLRNMFVICKPDKKFLVAGKAYAKPIVKKNPNKASYDIGGNVALSCHAEKTTTGYEINWYKLSSNGKPKQLNTVNKRVNNKNTKILFIKSLTNLDEGTYKCEIKRYRPLYSANVLVNISVKGNNLNDISL